MGMSSISRLVEPLDCMEAAWNYPIFPEAPGASPPSQKPHHSAPRHCKRGQDTQPKVPDSHLLPHTQMGQGRVRSRVSSEPVRAGAWGD